MCTTLGGAQGRKNPGELTSDRFQVIVSLFNYEHGGLVRSGYLGDIFGCFGALRGAPGVTVG